MDSLNTLRELRQSAQQPDPDTVTRARAALMNAIDAEPRSPSAGTTTAAARGPRRRTQRARWAWGLGLAATATAAALVIAPAVLPTGSPGAADPAAAAVLEDAARNAVRFADPPLRSGQYLRIDKVSRNAATSELVDGTQALYWQGEDSSKYVPYDRGDVWVWDRRPTGALRAMGDTTPEQFNEIKAAYGHVDAKAGELVTARNGDFYADDPDNEGVSRSEWMDVDSWPASPQAFLEKIRRDTAGAGQNPDNEAFVWLADRLRTGELDADTRALFYRTAALIPGVRVAAEDTSLDGRNGVALQAPQGSADTTWQLILDPDTGQYIGEREVGGPGTAEAYGVRADMSGVVLSSTSVTTSVVDSAPLTKGEG